MRSIVALCMVAVALLAAACASGDKPPASPAPVDKPNDKVRETIYAGVAKSRGVLELDGGLRLTTDGAHATRMEFGLALAPGANPMTVTTPDGHIEMSYIDADVAVNDLTYIVAETAGDRDGLLEPGETVSIRIDLAVACPECDIGAEHSFTLEIKPANGSYLVIQRTTPAALGSSVTLD